MEAGRLDRRITIMRATSSDDGFQTVLGEPVALFSRAASVEWVRDGERFSGGETQASVSVRFQVRYDSDTATIDERDSVLFDGKTYQIAGIKELGRRTGFEISAQARAEG